MQILRSASGLIVAGIGVFLVYGGAAWSAPFCSGIAFIILGVNLWIPNCPLIHGFKCASGTCKK